MPKNNLNQNSDIQLESTNSQTQNPEIKLEPITRDIDWQDKLAILLALMSISGAVAKVLFMEESDLAAYLREKSKNASFVSLNDFSNSPIFLEHDEQEVKEDQDLENSSEEEKNEKVEIIEDVNPFLEEQTGENVNLTPKKTISPKQMAGFDQVRNSLKSELLNENIEINYLDYLFQLIEIKYELTPEQSETLRANFAKKFQKNNLNAGDDIHKFAFEILNNQGRYNPTLDSAVYILLGTEENNNFNQEDPAGNCVGRAEDAGLQLLAKLPEDKIYFQYFNQMIDEKGDLKNVGHIRAVFEIDGEFYTTEGGEKVDVTEPGTLIVSAREAAKEFAGLGKARPSFYVPFSEREEKKLAEKRKNFMPPSSYGSLFETHHANYSLMPRHGSIEEQSEQPEKQEYNPQDKENQNEDNDQNSKKSKEENIEKGLKATNIPVPKNLEVNFQEYSNPAIQKLLLEYLNAKTEEEKDNTIVELAIRQTIFELNHRLRPIPNKYFYNSEQQILRIGSTSMDLLVDKHIKKLDFRQVKTRRKPLTEKQFTQVVNDPRIINAMEFAKNHKINSIVQTPQMQDEQTRRLLSRFLGLNLISRPIFNSPGYSLVSSETFKKYSAEARSVFIHNPPIGTKKSDFQGSKIEFRFDNEVSAFDFPNNISPNGTRKAETYYNLETGKVEQFTSAKEIAEMYFPAYLKLVNDADLIAHSNVTNLRISDGFTMSSYGHADFSQYSGTNGEKLEKEGQKLFYENLDKISHIKNISLKIERTEKNFKERVKKMLNHIESFEANKIKTYSISIASQQDNQQDLNELLEYKLKELNINYTKDLSEIHLNLENKNIEERNQIIQNLLALMIFKRNGDDKNIIKPQSISLRFGKKIFLNGFDDTKLRIQISYLKPSKNI